LSVTDAFARDGRRLTGRYVIALDALLGTTNLAPGEHWLR